MARILIDDEKIICINVNDEWFVNWLDAKRRYESIHCGIYNRLGIVVPGDDAYIVKGGGFYCLGNVVATDVFCTGASKLTGLVTMENDGITTMYLIDVPCESEMKHGRP